MSCTLLRGRRRVVRWAVSVGGRMPALEAWAELDEKLQARVEVLLERFADEGIIQSTDQFKKLAGTDLWEFKRSDCRVLCCVKRGEMVICHIVIKRRAKHQQSDLAKAARICSEDVGGHDHE